MPNKNFSIYQPDLDFKIYTHDHLVLEVGKSHMACIATKPNNKLIVAFELFTFKESEAENFDQLFSAISANSKLLAVSNPGAHVYINNEQSLLVPVFKFSKDIATHYLNIVYGDDESSKTLYEHLAIEPGMMNVYRVSEECYDVLNSNLPKATFKHTYTTVVKRLAETTASLPPQFISIHFFSTFFIVSVLKEGNLILIQSFVYETPEDVIYHLLNITQRFELFSDQLKIQVSGMIDLDFNLYRELIKYFKEIHVENVNSANLSLNLNEFPLHYFTPFFNLAI